MKTSIFKLSVLIFLLMLTPAVAAQKIKIIHGNTEKGTLDAVGAVYSLDENSRSLGTGTFIGNKRIITAAHVIKNYLPSKTNHNSGPVIIDLSSKEVYWTHDEDFGRGDPITKRYKVTKAVVDACFINAGGAKANRPTLDMIRCDVAFLKLESNPNDIKNINLVKNLTNYPLDALHVGYGDGEVATPESFDRKLRVQEITAYRAFDQWTIILSNTKQKVGTELNGLSFSAEPLTGTRDLSPEELSLTRAKVGDSGGPLLVKSSGNEIQILGVLSAYSDAYNSFSSLLVRKGESYKINPSINKMLSRLQ